MDGRRIRHGLVIAGAAVAAAIAATALLYGAHILVMFLLWQTSGF